MCCVCCSIYLLVLATACLYSTCYLLPEYIIYSWFILIVLREIFLICSELTPMLNWIIYLLLPLCLPVPVFFILIRPTLCLIYISIKFQLCLFVPTLCLLLCLLVTQLPTRTILTRYTQRTYPQDELDYQFTTTPALVCASLLHTNHTHLDII